jgi:hypothetical protein
MIRLKKLLLKKYAKPKKRLMLAEVLPLSLTPEEQQLADNFSSNKGKLALAC